MPLNIDDPETGSLVRQLAAYTGESITLAIKRAVEERLRRIQPASQKHALLEELAKIRKYWAALPVRDPRTADDILGYKENGQP